MIVATAGHIDHGKTLLIRALTGVDTDRLPEEKRRGISIDLGFAYWRPIEGQIVGFIDVPGHERFVRNMLAGICGIDLALLVVAADDGVMRQTTEHLQILDLLEIRDAIVVITKIDRVPPERVAEVSSQVLALLAPTALADASLTPVSAFTGEGIDTLKAQLLERLQTCQTRTRPDRRFRLAIDRAFSVVGAGTVVTGTVFDGHAAVGDRLMVSPAGVGVRVRSIQVSGGARQRIAAGERAALNISGAEIGVAGRGAWLIDEAVHAPTQRLDVRFRLLPSEPHALAHWTPVHVHLGTASSPARIATLRSRPIEPGTTASMQLVLERPFVAFHGDRFVIRDQSARRTLGGGVVVDPLALARGRSQPARLATFEALSSQTPSEAFHALLRIPEQPVDLAGYERRFNLTAEAADAIYRGAGATVLGKERRIAIAAEACQQLRRAIVEAVIAFHEGHPASAGLAPAALQKAVSPQFPAEAFQLLVRELVQAGQLHIVGGNIARPGFDDTSNAQDRALWDSVHPALERGGFSPPTTAELAAALRAPEARIKDLLHRKCRSGDVAHVAEHHFYPRATLAVLAATATALGAESPGGRFAAARFRDIVGTNRFLAIRILEMLDTLGITLRIGDERKVIKDFVPILGAAQPLALPQRAQPAGRPAHATKHQPPKPPPTRSRPRH